VHAVPGEPRRVRIEAVNSTAISVEWQAPLDRQLNGVIRGYQVHYALTDNLDGDDRGHSVAGRIYDTMNGSVYSAVIVGLRPESEYRVHVSAYTRRGDGLPSRIKRVRTKGAGASSMHFSDIFTSSSAERVIFSPVSVCLSVCLCLSASLPACLPLYVLDALF